MKIMHVLLGATLAATATMAQEVYTTWGSQRKLTLKASPATQGVAVTKFPLLVRLTSAQADVFTGSKGKGADIRFTNTTLTKRYKHHIERWDSAGQKAEIWVLVDSIPAYASVNLNLLWNKAGAADSSKGSAVFDTANGFVSVLHLGDSTSTNPRPNQVAGAPKGILQNFASEQDFGVTPRVYAPVAGAIGLADQLRGGNMGANFAADRDYIDLGHRSYAGFSDFTTGFFFSTWFNVTNSVQYERFIEMNDDTVGVGSSPERILLFGNHTTAPQNISVRWGAGGVSYNEDQGSRYTPGEWAHVAFSKQPGENPLRIYVNGVQIAQADGTGDPTVALREHVALGRPSVTQGDPYFSGVLDESILAKRDRSNAWVKLSYETQKPTATALTIGATAAVASNDTNFVGLSHAQRASAAGFSASASGNGLRFRLPATTTAGKVSVVDVWGREIWSRKVTAGARDLAWDGKAAAGQAARGVYVARFVSGSTVLEHRFTYNP